jgi:hypothetical protein
MHEEGDRMGKAVDASQTVDHVLVYKLDPGFYWVSESPDVPTGSIVAWADGVAMLVSRNGKTPCVPVCVPLVGCLMVRRDIFPSARFFAEGST